jgi:hypothetical protein
MKRATCGACSGSITRKNGLVVWYRWRDLQFGNQFRGLGSVVESIQSSASHQEVPQWTE